MSSLFRNKSSKIIDESDNIFKLINEKSLEEKEANIIYFINKLYIILKYYHLCHLSGTIIFEDNNSQLYNLLTYGINDRNMGKKCYKGYNISTPHWTITHKKIYDKENIESAEDCIKLSSKTNLSKKILTNNEKCKKNKCFKLEFIFNKSLDYLCDINTNASKKKDINKSSKGVLLYYRFKYENIIYLFFKLEGHPMISLSHVASLISKKRNDEYLKRREDENIEKYIELINLDIDFYNQISKLLRLPYSDIKNKLDLYDINLRTGKELFIIEELKDFIINYNNNEEYNKILNDIKITKTIKSNKSKGIKKHKSIKIKGIKIKTI
jgi:hypothetical protein